MKTVQILQALLTPLIAIIATYIAYQQWNTNKLKLKLDRYERRLRVYQKIVETLQLIGRDLDPKLDDLLKYRVSVAEACFLFGSEISRHCTIHGLHRSFKNPPICRVPLGVYQLCV